ncbi:MAG: hypothetical protein VKK97_05430 [Synechococcaceae cyanobacterium]|nr:hypothetical protein [Synechococcaceae cyanobacterium]
MLAPPLALNTPAWPQPLATSLASLVLPLALLAPRAAAAFDTIGRCQAWQGSHGIERILLGNAIGAAHYLTKRQKLLQSPAEAPLPLYRDSDLQRVCGGR